MTEWCWFGLGLMCLAVGAAVVLMVLLVWFTFWLINSNRRSRRRADGAGAIPGEACGRVSTQTKAQLVAASGPVLVENPEAPPTSTPAAPTTSFTTYENRRLGRITIHRPGCRAIDTKSGAHRRVAGQYLEHASYQAAAAHAAASGLHVRDCGICKPSPGQVTVT